MKTEHAQSAAPVDRLVMPGHDFVVDFVTCPACQCDLDGERSEYGGRDDWPEYLSLGCCSAECARAEYKDDVSA